MKRRKEVETDMASSKEYLDFVLEQLSELDEVSSRAMMDEYVGSIEVHPGDEVRISWKKIL